MGTWGIGPFENDAAADFVGELLENENVLRTLLSALQNRGLDVDAKCRQLAACGVVAFAWSASTRYLTAELNEFVLAQSNDVWAKLRNPARLALKQLNSPSELKELWDESGDQLKWVRQLSRLRALIERPQKLMPMASREQATPRSSKQRHRALQTGECFRIALENGEHAFGRVCEGDQLAFLDFFTRKVEALPPKSSKELYRTLVWPKQVSTKNLEILTGIVFEQIDTLWRLMFGREFPNFYVKRAPGVEESVDTDEVVGLDSCRMLTIQSLKRRLGSKKKKSLGSSHWPELWDEKEEPDLRPWSEWPRLRRHFVMKYGENFHEVLRKREHEEFFQIMNKNAIEAQQGASDGINHSSKPTKPARNRSRK